MGLLAVEAMLFIAAAALLAGENAFGACFAAAGCGLQNAMTSFYSGSSIRSTHLTGFFTDFGLVLGQVCRGHPVPRRRLAMWALVLFGFSTGAWSQQPPSTDWDFSHCSCPRRSSVFVRSGFGFIFVQPRCKPELGRPGACPRWGALSASA